MSGKQKINTKALQRALDGRRPASLTREGRVALLVEVADALLTNRIPKREAALFVGSGIDKWLQDGGDLARDFFQVVKAHSHHTPSFIYWQQFAEPCTHPDEGTDESDSSISESQFVINQSHQEKT